MATKAEEKVEDLGPKIEEIDDDEEDSDDEMPELTVRSMIPFVRLYTIWALFAWSHTASNTATSCNNVLVL